LFVRDFQFEGNHVFTSAELGKVVSSFTNRWLNTENLEEARRAVTVYYVGHNYINSGAVIPDQDPTNGIIRIKIIEGVLSEINLHGNRWLRDSYIKSRIERWTRPPLNLNRAQEGLQLLRENPNVEKINAELKPGVAPGQSQLDLRVVDRQPFHFGLQADNQRPPTVGAEEIWAIGSDDNLTGNSDPLRIQYGIANATAQGLEFSGDDNMEGSYLLPITRFDTTLAFNGSRLNSSIIENAFQPLHITSLTSTYGVVLRQPVYQTANQEAAVSIGFDWRKNRTWQGTNAAPFSPGATADGEMIVAPLRLAQDWILRGQSHVVALRSTFSVGLNVLGATDVSGSTNAAPGIPNAKFFSWTGQGQYIQRLFNTQNQLVFRLSGQWTPDPLLALEQMSVGGLETVRGYPENQLVRDRGIVTSLEFRVPILYNKAGAGVLQLAPFFDFGGAWNVDGSPEPTTIYSTGSGLLLNVDKRVSAELYWGYRLRHVQMPSDAGAQGLGIAFRVNVQAF
jgi:hemolysin activation/secretion protein